VRAGPRRVHHGGVAQPISAQDSLWLAMDRPTNLMVIDGVMVLGAPLELGSVMAVLHATGQRFPIFRCRAVERGGSWTWDDADDFDINRHVHAVALGDGAGLAELQEFVAAQRSVPLDRDRPLWQVFVVSPLMLDDGIEGSAVLTRFHHAIADGVRATQVMLGMCELADGGTIPVVARSGAGDGPLDPVGLATGAVVEAARVTRGLAGALADGARSTVGLLRGGVTDVVRAGVEGVEAGIELVRHPDRLVDALEVVGAGDHRVVNDVTSVAKLLLTASDVAVWSGTPGERKAVAWSRPIPLDRVKAIGRGHGATVNDVLITAVAVALREYLCRRGELVEEVVWMVPVNLTPISFDLPEELGNHFALVMLPMPLHHRSHDDTLAEMRRRMQRIKHSDEAVLTFGVQQAVSMSPAQVGAFLTTFFANKAVGVLTNVPGPSRQMTFAGAPVAQVVGFAPCSGDQTLTTTIFSYDGSVTVGFASDAALVPHPGELVDLVVATIEEMEA